MKLDVTILGSNSAIPAYGRFPSSQILGYDSGLYLIDCGEGCQFQLAKYRIKPSKIKAVFISHMHGDHVFGLPGLLTSMSLLGRSKPLTVYGPLGIRSFLEGIFAITEAHFSYDLHIHESSPHGLESLADFGHLQVSHFPLKHRIPTNGYLFREVKRQQNIDPELITKYNLDYTQIKAIKLGQDIQLSSGIVLKNNEMIKVGKAPRSYAYCSDTVYDMDILPWIRGVDVLYHEATYLDDKRDMALERMHTTAKQAGVIANRADVGKLIIGHFSSRYKDLSPLLEEAKEEFGSTFLAVEGETFAL